MIDYKKKYLKYKSKYLQLKGGSDYDGQGLQDAAMQACRDYDLSWLKSLGGLKFDNGGTIAHYFASKGDAYCLRMLHNAGVDLGVIGNGNGTPAFLAAKNGHAKCLEVLRDAGVALDVATLGGAGTPAHWAAERGHVECLEVLGTYNLNLLNSKNGMGATPAHIAAENGYVECLERMAEYGVNMYVSDNERRTPAHMATINGKARSLEVIIHSVSQTHDPMVARNMLICRDNNDNTPVLNAVWGNHLDCLELLADYGVTHIPILNGWTPAHYAAQYGHVDCLEILHRRGVSLSEPESNRLTPLDVAEQNGQGECRDYILRSLEEDYDSDL